MHLSSFGGLSTIKLNLCSTLNKHSFPHCISLLFPDLSKLKYQLLSCNSAKFLLFFFTPNCFRRKRKPQYELRMFVSDVLQNSSIEYAAFQPPYIKNILYVLHVACSTHMHGAGETVTPDALYSPIIFFAEHYLILSHSSGTCSV